VKGSRGPIPEEPGKILLRATNWIGDVIMTLPALEALRELYPATRITVCARPWVRSLFEAHPAVDGILPLEKGRGVWRDGLEVVRVAGRARSMDFDMGVLFQNAFEAALIARLAGIPVRVGYATDGRGPLLTHPIERRASKDRRHQVEDYLDIIRAMGWSGQAGAPRVFVVPRDRHRADDVLAGLGISEGDFVLGMAPGAAYGPAKRWPAERFARVADRVVEEYGARVVAFGSDGDNEACREVTQRMRGPAVNLCGRTGLGEAVALIGACSLFITNDSGLMHVASALDIPTVAIFGSTNPTATGPLGSKSRVVRNPVSCAPCLRPRCREDYRCMLGISPDAVFQEILRLLKSLGEGSDS